MRWEDTRVGRQARGTVATFFVWSGLRKVDDCLFGEVGHIIHRLHLSLLLGWAQNDGILEHDIAVVCDQFAANWTIKILWLECLVPIAAAWFEEVALNTYSTFTKCFTFCISAVLGLYSSSGKR